MHTGGLLFFGLGGPPPLPSRRQSMRVSSPFNRVSVTVSVAQVDRPGLRILDRRLLGRELGKVAGSLFHVTDRPSGEYRN